MTDHTTKGIIVFKKTRVVKRFVRRNRFRVMTAVAAALALRLTYVTRELHLTGEALDDQLKKNYPDAYV